MARVGVAAALERIGLRRLAEAARRVRWHGAVLRWVLRPRTAARLTAAWAREPVGRRAYRVLSEDELRATRRSDTVFVFGSGRSIADIAPEEWERIAADDTVAFSHFHRQRSVRVDYHLIAELLDLEGTAESIRANPCYRNTIFVVIKGWLAWRSNQLVSRTLLPQGARVARLRRTARGYAVPPSRAFRDGLVHGTNSSLDATNFAYLMGWKRIVVAGVDLYNTEYFWLPSGATTDEHAERGRAAGTPFPGAEETVATFALWSEQLADDGVSLEVYDRRSLLARVLPVFSRSDA